MLAAGAVVLGIGALSVTAAPAQAVKDGCPNSIVCVYEHSYFRGTPQLINGFAAETNLKPGIQDRASSWTNGNLRASAMLGEWRSGKRVGITLAPQSSIGDLTTVGFNDRADFVKRI